MTEPSGDMELGVFQPLGFNDWFHLGQVTMEVGNAFSCSDEELWGEKYTRSPTELSVNNLTITHPYLINREGN